MVISRINLPRSTWKALSYAERIKAGSRQLPNGCWEWLGAIDRYGYGRMTYLGRPDIGTHRVSYREFVGEISPGFSVDHLCHTRDISCRKGDTCPHRRCVNPRHLEAVPSAVNSQRGTQNQQPNCVNGHPKTEANTYTWRGHRACRICRNEASQRRNARKAGR